MLYENSIGVVNEEDSSSYVSHYYGKELEGTHSLKTNACCTSTKPPPHLLRLMNQIHDEVVSKYYGCGFVCPDLLEGCRVLDLGCGAGRDVYILSQLVGEKGYVVGVDFTPEMLQVARKHVDWHMSRFGYSKPNVEFVEASIEDLSQLPSNSFDIIVSNCVINLCHNKKAVFQEAFRLLKPSGGELYFSDVYASQRISQSLKNDPILWGECLSGALYWNDFLRLAREVGFGDPRLVEDSPITINTDKDVGAAAGNTSCCSSNSSSSGSGSLRENVGLAKFYSATYRLLKIPELEPDCEDYGQAIMYKGTVTTHPHSFPLDNHHNFPSGKVVPVCGNTYRMLHQTRLQPHFEFFGGGFTQHFGLFEGCGKSVPFSCAKSVVDSLGSVGGGGGCGGGSCC